MASTLPWYHVTSPALWHPPWHHATHPSTVIPTGTMSPFLAPHQLSSPCCHPVPCHLLVTMVPRCPVPPPHHHIILALCHLPVTLLSRCHSLGDTRTSLSPLMCQPERLWWGPGWPRGGPDTCHPPAHVPPEDSERFFFRGGSSCCRGHKRWEPPELSPERGDTRLGGLGTWDKGLGTRKQCLQDTRGGLKNPNWGLGTWQGGHEMRFGVSGLGDQEWGSGVPGLGA